VLIWRKIKEIFPNLVENKLFKPELALAFGGSLKFVGNNPYPSFLRKKITKEEFKKNRHLCSSYVFDFSFFNIYNGKGVFC
jgi:hypothetical protein